MPVGYQATIGWGLPSTTTTAVTGPAVHGMYLGFDAGSPLTTGTLDAYQSTNALTVRYCHEFGDNAQFSFFATGTNFGHWNSWVGVSPGTRRFTYSCPLLDSLHSGDYTGLNAGSYDSTFTSLGSAFQAQPNLRNSIVRLGWEFNGNTFPWGIPANSTDAQLASYKSGYNRIAGILKTQCPTLSFEWCPNAHLDNANRTLEDMYPGDTYVDYIGLAVYDYYWPGGTPTAAQRQDWLVDDTNGLLDQWGLAQSRGKPVAFTEWGLWPTTNNTGGGDRPAFITLMCNWMRDHNAAYSIYNNVNATQDHRLNTYPNSKTTYLSRFATGVLV